MGVQDMMLPRAVVYAWEKYAKNTVCVNNNLQKRS